MTLGLRKGLMKGIRFGDQLENNCRSAAQIIGETILSRVELGGYQVEKIPTVLRELHEEFRQRVANASKVRVEEIEILFEVMRTRERKDFTTKMKRRVGRPKNEDKIDIIDENKKQLKIKDFFKK